MDSFPNSNSKAMAQDHKDPDNYNVGKEYKSGYPMQPGCTDSGKTASYNVSANQKGNEGC